MLFVTICRAKPASTTKARTERRDNWQYPPGMNVVAEYWPIGSDLAVIVVAEAESPGPIMAAIAQWEDHFEFQVMPVVTAEEGLELAAQMQ